MILLPRAVRVYVATQPVRIAMGRHTQFADLDVKGFRNRMELHVEALNRALVNIPAERVRMHLCWGNYPGPHHGDVALADIVDIVWRAKPHAVLFEAANAHDASLAGVSGGFDLGQTIRAGNAGAVQGAQIGGVLGAGIGGVSGGVTGGTAGAAAGGVGAIPGAIAGAAAGARTGATAGSAIGGATGWAVGAGYDAGHQLGAW